MMKYDKVVEVGGITSIVRGRGFHPAKEFTTETQRVAGDDQFAEHRGDLLVAFFLGRFEPASNSLR